MMQGFLLNAEKGTMVRQLLQAVTRASNYNLELRHFSMSTKVIVIQAVFVVCP
jgi:hypothetical protein